ncbi:putative acyltransferase [Janibacter sp. HTCC2649]|uniref:acyltransferase family protein n=1 Tax=Janibacter sp. HTCC2649 TaxID=313589 RepID=UPI0000670F3F|nr:acyltransferase [Janibacter sp. HTCC2649]EAP97266.1 putative acyltransferase [Janibacter sp. HTCC2649]
MTASSSVTLDASKPSGPQSASYVAGLTGLRGFAAMNVVLVHVSVLTPHAWLGLHGFGPIALFVLSGYLLIKPWSKAAVTGRALPSLRSFAIRRVLRIFPAYLVCLVLVAMLIPTSQPHGSAQWLRALTLTTIYSGDYGPPALFHTWSLCVEFAWYVFAPIMGGLVVLAVRSSRHGPARGLTALAVCALVTPVFLLWEERGLDAAQSSAHFWLPAWLAAFALGAMVCHVETMHQAGRTSAAVKLLVGLASKPVVLPILAVVLLYVVQSPTLGGGYNFEPTTATQDNTRYFANIGLALVLLVSIIFSPRPSIIARVFATRPMEALGRWSYGIYLANLPLVHVMSSHFPSSTPGEFIVRVGAITAASIGLGAAAYALIERPAMDLSRRLT